MGRQSLFPLFDRILDGTLADRLRDARQQGLSYNEIAIRLRDDGVKVTGETVRRWVLDLADGEDAA